MATQCCKMFGSFEVSHDFRENYVSAIWANCKVAQFLKHKKEEKHCVHENFAKLLMYCQIHKI